MIKSSLIGTIAKKNPKLNYQDVEKIVNMLLEEMTQALANGGRVEIRGFGSFSVRKRAARLARAPLAQKVISVEEKMVPFFRAGKNLKERLNSPDSTLSNS
ncbi:integration host factor subunit beta [Candidatus Liberibacter asiaticus]|uniref:Integration host factor, beta subunit n=2 Tax=Liberibacter asiaticus TaxID=34021 RepID=C6XFR8_LIBAP|nr:integration host factor subunit beta [Candidatus Liberibacter asiaticus]ACT57221.1 integration host factor, beta subunit [Candidatus Liberibacter asiaticus str. psy62]AGH16819.1 integration host factor subunit beta [Candidatus Liberibacter asiaticus str. gxpsy]ALK07179.1 integration host factor subunit beta [Candidatus Liberibacter asiaticus]ASK52659.1 integration host factor subunit beta [Candidatus Liberibacter asiaticus]AWL13983.1 integration host factor subunit beta [Candidatus Liberiba